MEKDHYQAWYTSPLGVHSPLDSISASDDQEAQLLLGKVARRRSEELDAEGLLSLTNSAGEDVGMSSRVGEHLIQG